MELDSSIKGRGRFDLIINNMLCLIINNIKENFFLENIIY